MGSKGKFNSSCVSFCKHWMFVVCGMFVSSSPVISDIRIAGLQAASLLQHLSLFLHRDHTHISGKCISILDVRCQAPACLIVGVCARFLPVRPAERCCAWPAVWSHLTAGTSAGWWELCRRRHAHINEIIWSVDSHLPAESYSSSLLSSMCIFFKVDNEGRKPFNTKSGDFMSFYWKKQNPLEEPKCAHTKKRF